jgi:hypothetical protein
MGKGSAPRPLSIDKQTFNENFDKIFGNKSKERPQETCETKLNPPKQKEVQQEK